MTKEFAALLAQVVPVLGLALGLEIRSLGPRVVELARNDKRKPEDRPSFSKVELVNVAYALSLAAMPALGTLEMKALYVASGSSADVPFLALYGTIAILFLAPIPAGISYFAESWNAFEGRWTENVFWFGPLLSVALITIIALADVLFS